MHQTVGNVLPILLHGQPPKDISKAKDFIDEALSIAMHAMRAASEVVILLIHGAFVDQNTMPLRLAHISNFLS